MCEAKKLLSIKRLTILVRRNIKKILAMPNKDLLLPGISAGAGLLSTGINALTQINSNKQSRRFAVYMYDRQRADALADYNMQNEYNHPSSQMTRLKEAGLNPNLVYDNGATYNASPIRSSSAQSWNPEPPKVDTKFVGDSLMSYYDVQMRQAQIDNLRTQNTVMLQDALLRKAQVESTLTGAEKTRLDIQQGTFDLGLKQSIKPYSLEAARLGVEKTKTDIDVTLDRNEREQLRNAASISEIFQRIVNMKMSNRLTAAQISSIQAQIKTAGLDQSLKELDINLKKQGIQPSDNVFLRMGAQLANTFLKEATRTEGGKLKVDARKAVSLINEKIRNLFR